MHRSNFRPRRSVAQAQPAAPQRVQPSPPAKELEEIRSQLSELSRSISPIRANVERLAAPQEDISVPADIAVSLRKIHNRLDRLERNQGEIESQSKRMATTFSNAILKLADKVEKIAGGEDSSFSLAHSLEKLIFVLSNRKLRIKRDNDGNMVELETEV